jgi:putative tricarboxylic transport membrane protein
MRMARRLSRGSPPCCSGPWTQGYCSGAPAPMLLAFILGPLTEEYLRRVMLLSRGNTWVFVERPISATLLALAVLAMAGVLPPAFGRTRAQAF